jgi:hypothetical protein
MSQESSLTQLGHSVRQALTAYNDGNFKARLARYVKRTVMTLAQKPPPPKHAASPKKSRLQLLREQNEVEDEGTAEELNFAGLDFVEGADTEIEAS